MLQIQEPKLKPGMTADEWEKLWASYINALVKRDELIAARESQPFGQRPTRQQMKAADLRVARAIAGIRRTDVRFANAVCPAYWL